MRSRLSRAVLVAVLALVHAGVFTWYQRPDWTANVWTDQEGYRRLGSALARTGRFTRYPDTRPFVPEVLRTPGYPAFVAAVYRTFGESQGAIAAVQSVVFAALCLMVMTMIRPLAGDDAAFAAGLITAAYSPLPYFGALVLTELWTAFLMTIACWRSVVALRSGSLRDYAVAGAAFALVALTRPAFVLLPIAVAGCAWLLWVPMRRTAFAQWSALALAFLITLSPWLAYNYIYLHRVTMSPAGGVGRAMWEGSWHGVWSGRTQSALTEIAASDADGQALEDRVRRLAADAHDEPGPMLEYVSQWRRIRAIWDTPTEPSARASARIEADQEYLRVGLENDRRDWVGYVKRRLARGILLLWAGDLPIRYTDINQTPVVFRRAIWLVQAGLLVVAAYGCSVLWKAGRWRETALLVVPLVYTTAVHLPFSTEPRIALPAKPIVLALAGVGVAGALGRVRRTEQAITSPETSGA